MLYVCSNTDVSQQMSITIFFKFDFQQHINFINEPQCFYSKVAAVSSTSFSFPLGGHHHCPIFGVSTVFMFIRYMY